MTTVYVDTETTGLYRHAGHEVWEVALIRESGDRVDEYVWQLPVDAGKADPMALTISGWYDRRAIENRSGNVDVEGAVAEHQFVIPPDSMSRWAAWFAQLTVGAIWVGAVPSFDTGFLDPLLREYGACPGWHYQLVDVETLAIGYLRAALIPGDKRLTDCFRPNGSWDSNRLSGAVGVNPDRFERHTALGDCHWAKAIYDAVTGPRG